MANSTSNGTGAARRVAGFVPTKALAAKAAEATGPLVVKEVTDPLLTRTSYFDGRLLTADDLIRDQQYLDERLMEVGRVGGDGVVRGLTLDLDETAQTLTVGSGVAVTPTGRTLVVDEEFQVRLGERATIARLNRGRHSAHFPSGLYAVVLMYLEHETGLAEAYPTDLASKRTLKPDTIVEGVEVVLVPLEARVPTGGEASARAQLAARIIGRESSMRPLPEDGVALGVLAISDDSARWCDPELLRHPRRLPFSANASVSDLARHYESVFERVQEERRTARLADAFAATDYFHRLPPVGAAPAASFDPEAGTQSYFPSQIEVWVAPVRTDDLAQIRREALDLDWIDLDVAEPAQVLVLAELDPERYEALGRRLEAPAEMVPRLLPRFDGLQLRVVALPPVHRIDTDAAVWKELWAGLSEEVVFVRRQPRAAETGVSGIVLARGYVPPVPHPVPEPGPEPGTEGGGGVPPVDLPPVILPPVIRPPVIRPPIVLQPPVVTPVVTPPPDSGTTDTGGTVVTRPVDIGGTIVTRPVVTGGITDPVGTAGIGGIRTVETGGIQPVIGREAAAPTLADVVKARSTTATRTDAAAVVAAAKRDPELGAKLVAIAAKIDPAGDAALWKTLVAAIQQKKVDALATAVAKSRTPLKPAAMVTVVTKLALGTAVVSAWKKLAA